MKSAILVGSLIPCLCVLLVNVVSAQQVGTSISADGALPNSNAMLDVQSPATGDGKGMLIPRLSANQRTQASAAVAGGLLDNSGNLRGGPAQGLLVYQIDGTQGFYYNNSTTATPSWSFIGGGTGDFKADGSVPMTGNLNAGGQAITNAHSMAFRDAHVQIGNDAKSYSSAKGSVAVGAGATARYRNSGVAIGVESDGDYNGIGIGYSADGQYTNIAIGYAASAYSGYDRIAIGNSITNRRNDSVAMRGSLYLDGGTEVYVRPTVGTGTWTLKAFTIDHPLDPENKVLRHYCMEGPDVWNVYAGNARIENGKAVVELPDYYTALNKVGSEVFSVTPVGGLFLVGVDKVHDNRFTILAGQDGEVSWSIKVLRNDAACIEELKRRPVEQLKHELESDQIKAENQTMNTCRYE